MKDGGTGASWPPPLAPSPANCAGRGGELTPPERPDQRQEPSPTLPLPRSWGRGRRPSRGTSEKAVGGEGPPVAQRRANPVVRSNQLAPTHRPALPPPHRVRAGAAGGAVAEERL